MLCCRQLREAVHRAYLIRASDQEAESAKDNTKLINHVLQLKQEKAKLLGKANFAELSLASKMATFDQAMSLLTQLRDSSHAVKKRARVGSAACFCRGEVILQGRHDAVGRLLLWSVCAKLSSTSMRKSCDRALG